MSRRMSCSMTVDAVRDRSKTVTRRHVDSWKNLRPGDRLTLIEKGMGLPKGARQVVLAEVVVVDVRVEALGMVNASEVRREGLLPRAVVATRGTTVSTADWFVRFWLAGHGYGKRLDLRIGRSVECRRIEWRYLDDEASA